MWKKILIFLFLVSSISVFAESLYLRENLALANAGDYIVTLQNRNYTVLHIFNKSRDRLVIEEITVPSSRIRKDKIDWKRWVEAGAPQNTSWVIYRLNLNTGVLEDQYSFTAQKWVDTRSADHFLSTLLNLKLEKVSPQQRTKIGHSSRIWQPKMVMDGQTIDGVKFDAWRTYWAQDGSELAGKKIEVYVPEESEKYPSYFPYWLQISSMAGKAKVRIVDSGKDLQSPKQILLK